MVPELCQVRYYLWEEVGQKSSGSLVSAKDIGTLKQSLKERYGSNLVEAENYLINGILVKFTPSEELVSNNELKGDGLAMRLIGEKRRGLQRFTKELSKLAGSPDLQVSRKMIVSYLQGN